MWLLVPVGGMLVAAIYFASDGKYGLAALLAGCGLAGFLFRLALWQGFFDNVAAGS